VVNFVCGGDFPFVEKCICRFGTGWAGVAPPTFQPDPLRASLGPLPSKV
jgi:hypothetical protein